MLLSGPLFFTSSSNIWFIDDILEHSTVSRVIITWALSWWYITEKEMLLKWQLSSNWWYYRFSDFVILIMQANKANAKDLRRYRRRAICEHHHNISLIRVTAKNIIPCSTCSMTQYGHHNFAIIGCTECCLRGDHSALQWRHVTVTVSHTPIIRLFNSLFKLT